MLRRLTKCNPILARLSLAALLSVGVALWLLHHFTVAAYAELRAAALARVPILMYHRIEPLAADAPTMVRRMTVTPAQFEAQVQWLRENDYTAISFQQLEETFRDGEDLPPRPVIITFDDGHDEHASIAAPILSRFNLTATFFIHTGFIGQVNSMTWDDVRELARRGFEIGSHTRTHPHLTALSDRQLVEELEGSKEDIKRELGIEPEVVAYPFGDCDARVVAAAEEAGYEIAAGVKPGVFQRAGERYTLHRIEVRGGDDLASFAKLVRGQLIRF